MLQELENSNHQAALMRIAEPFSLEIRKENVTLPTLFDMYNRRHEKESLPELILLGKQFKMEVAKI